MSNNYKRISIFGLGYVGCIGVGCLSNLGHHVIGVDINRIKVDLINTGRATIVEKGIDALIQKGKDKRRIEATTDSDYAVKNSDISFICVGTPNNKKGELDLGHILKVSEHIGKALKKKDSFHVIAIRSTVMPGTYQKVVKRIRDASGKKEGEKFSVILNPEFLREGSAVDDFMNPPFIVIAGASKKSIKIIREVYRGINKDITQVSVPTAEVIKLVNNSYHALKIVFANEVGRVCKRLGIDSYEVMELFCKDMQLNISPAYFKPGFAYGGSCLPKDLKALSCLGSNKEMSLPVIKSIDASNRKHIELAKKLILDKNKKKIGFMGLSFKSGTDDLRFSPALEIVEFLLGKDYQVKVYDSNINTSNLMGKNQEYLLKKLPHIAEVLTTSLNDLVEESEILVVANKEKEFLKFIKKNKDKISNKIIIDFVRIEKNIENLKMKNYEGICW